MDIYKEMDADTIIITRDLNAHILNKTDVLMVDDVPERKVLDDQQNSQGIKLLNFVEDIKGCIVNGRVTPHLDNFMSTSHKGNAVVDYTIVRQHELKKVVEMSVLSCIEETDKQHLEELISDKSKLPDITYCKQ